MIDFHEKRKLKQFLYSKVTLVVLAIVVLLLLNSVWNIFLKERVTNTTRKKLEREFVELQEREALLREEIERLSTPRGVEEEIRSKFEVAKEGEETMVIIDPGRGDSADTDDSKKSFWSRLFNIF